LIYGVDAVHGHNGVKGATVFPHNIGLGASRDPELAKKIGRATAEEVSGTGIDWTFAPCLCVARDDRWGRTYESFGEVPQIAASMTTIIDGFQGRSLNGPASILATAKHYIGDGGTTNGKDQGNTEISEQELR
jgi:beta-glucosidase